MNNYVGSEFDELQLEREAHRKTWRQLEQVQRENAALKKLLDRANERMDELNSGGLSQQDGNEVAHEQQTITPDDVPAYVWGESERRYYADGYNTATARLAGAKQ